MIPTESERLKIILRAEKRDIETLGDSNQWSINIGDIVAYDPDTALSSSLIAKKVTVVTTITTNNEPATPNSLFLKKQLHLLPPTFRASAKRTNQLETM
jgi:hypothetical protein